MAAGTVSTLIAALQRALAAEGDLPVETEGPDRDEVGARQVAQVDDVVAEDCDGRRVVTLKLEYEPYPPKR